MILGKINQPDSGLFALISAPTELSGLPQQIINIIVQQLGPNLDQAILNLATHPHLNPDQHLVDVFSATTQRVVDLSQAYGAPQDFSVVIGKAQNLGDDQFRILLSNLGNHHIYFQDHDGTFLHAEDQVPNIINATLTPGSRLILATPSIREYLVPSDLARLIAHMPNSDATAEQIVLRHLEHRAGDKEILIWTAKTFSPQGVKMIPESEKGLSASVRLARLNDRLKSVVDQLSDTQPALERLKLEMTKANLEYWLAYTLRQTIADKLPPILSPSDLVHLPNSSSPEHVVHAYDPEEQSYLIRQSQRRGHRHDHHIRDLGIDRFTLESWQHSRLNEKQADLLDRAVQALTQMKASHQDFYQKKRTHDLFVRQAEDLQWENRRHALRQKVSDIH